MEILSLVALGFVVCVILWVMTATFGFPVGPMLGAVIIAAAYGAFVLFFALASVAIDSMAPK